MINFTGLFPGVYSRATKSLCRSSALKLAILMVVAGHCFVLIVFEAAAVNQEEIPLAGSIQLLLTGNAAVQDLPDEKFVDANGDGIDGEISKAVFVDAISGNDDNTGLKPGQALKTLAKGLLVAKNTSGREYLIISRGDYNELNLILDTNISLYGGYDASAGWARSTDQADKAFIHGGTKGLTGTGLQGVVIDLLRIEAAEAVAPGESSYGIFLSSCTDVSLTRSTIIAGDAMGGQTGATGVTGSSGGNGGTGQSGCEDSDGLCETCSRPNGGTGGGSSCSANGGQGGRPGHETSNGDSGAGGSGPAGGQGGSGGTSQDTCGAFSYSCACMHPDSGVRSETGADGGNGSSGQNGNGGLSFGTMTGDGYLAASGGNGTAGSHGSGGGGGGGGHGGDNSCNSYGSGGGGGGGGGCGGDGGKGGNGGGSSFAVWLYNCEGVTITDNIIASGNGGAGGHGGNGGPGGSGGPGGAGGSHSGSNEQDDGGCGGWGGDGGNGGQGGYGGGGGGGSSIGIIMNSGTVIESGNTYLTGSSGSGGTSSGNNGAPGISDDLYKP